MPDPQTESLSHFIWRTHYRDADALAPESSIVDTWNRVAGSVAAVERDPLRWRQSFLRLLANYRFLPAGRILAGAGVSRQVTLANCFVMGLIEDSIAGIFDALKEGALTMQQGGGVGYDFSTLRPRGSRARTTGMIASGPVSFLHVWDATCATILSTGARRGAMMATLRCDHPDIEEFIVAKRSRGALTHFNLSVLVTDAFMQAVRADAPWPLVFPQGSEDERTADTLERPWSAGSTPVACRKWKTIRARELWRKLCASAHESAEPGVLFIDRINAENNLGYVETLSATNPCAEEPLPPYGSCNLGSLNLTAFVIDPFTPTARVDEDALRDFTRLAVRFLDDAIDTSRFPLPRQRLEAHRSRRIGLGVTGLADALAMLGLRYDSEKARTVAGLLMRTVRDAAYEASVDLAGERGPFELFDRQRYTARPFIHRLPQTIQAAIHRHGTRNSHLLAVAPAGTISLLAENLSSGIEPINRLHTDRAVLDERGKHQRFVVTDRAYALWQAQNDASATPPEYFLELASIAPREQLLMQAALQPQVDGSISKTVGLAKETSAQAVEELFESAYELRLKGCTVFRDTSRPTPLAARAESVSSSPTSHCCDTEREAD